jgi:nitrate/nitrite-specific signal transduction histidine kinase
MNPPVLSPQFPVRISRRLSLALIVLFALVLLVGGISLTLAIRIYRMSEAIEQEYAHMQITEGIDSTLDSIILIYLYMEAAHRFDRMGDVERLHGELLGYLETYRDLHPGDQYFPQKAQELPGFAALWEQAAELQTLTDRLLAAPDHERRLNPEDLDRLHGASVLAPRMSGELAQTDRFRVMQMLQAGEGMMRTIVALYVAFLIVGGAVIAVATVAFGRGIIVPVQKLAAAALKIAEGRLDERVPVSSRNEIGQLSHSFNVMADRLQAHERELRATHEELAQKVRETQALYQIGTEISALHELDRILHSVVNNARELLHTEAAALCLKSPGQDDLLVRATSGPEDAFRPGTQPAPCRSLGAEALDAPECPCPTLFEAYRRAQLTAPLRLGDRLIGRICVACRKEREFTGADTELLAGLAAQAALAIENARLYKEVQSLATIKERERIAREMHDGLAQALSLLHLGLQRLQGGAAGGATQTAEDLKGLLAIADRAYEEVRQSIFGLRTMVSRGLGLIPTLTEFLHEFSARNGITVALEAPDGAPRHLPPSTEVQLVRIIQEALANVHKHAAAEHAWVRIRWEHPSIQVIVEDDGRGFDPHMPASPDRRHFGFQTMRERAEGLGGTLEIDSAPGGGTRVIATLPAEG